MDEGKAAIAGDRSVRQRRSDDAMMLVVPLIIPNVYDDEIGVFMPPQGCEMDRFSAEVQGKELAGHRMSRRSSRTTSLLPTESKK